jgi:nicotinamide phosphoribosyltransferase
MKRIRPITNLERTQYGEYETYRRLIQDVYPNGILSIVSDTWDLWFVLTNTIPKLKEAILARDGKIVIRPDSGDPVDIICGLDINEMSHVANVNNTHTYATDYVFETSTSNVYRVKSVGVDQILTKVSVPEVKGVVQLLWETFGGTTNSKGYKELDSHIGAIYGDSITLLRTVQICERLKANGFASTNVVLGIGSFTYALNSRDSLGFAIKSTHVTINGKENNIFKDPITDDGVKKSQTGRVVVLKDADGNINFKDGLTIEEEKSYDDVNLLQTIFEDGKMVKEIDLIQVRENIRR